MTMLLLPRVHCVTFPLILLVLSSNVLLSWSDPVTDPPCEPNCFCIPNKEACPDIGARLTALQYFANGSGPSLSFFLGLQLVGEYEPLDCQPYASLVEAGIVTEKLCDDRPSKTYKKQKNKKGRRMEEINVRRMTKKVNGKKKAGKDQVCAFVYDQDTSCGSYAIETFPNAEAVYNYDGIAKITHYGACGACSSAQDLAVYMNPLLGPQSFVCATQGLDDVGYNFPAAFGCFLALGFTEDCAYVWASNGANSAESGCTESCRALFDVCLPVGDPKCPDDRCVGIQGCASMLPLYYNDENCDLIECLDCDERNSGEIFAAFAGRTRRNSGILTSYELVPGSGVWYGLKHECSSIANIRQEVVSCGLRN